MSTTTMSAPATGTIEEKLREGGYLVDVRFHKIGTNITISPQVLGVDIRSNDELGDFFNQFVKNSQISWLGKKNGEILKAQSIAKSVHKKKKKLSLDGQHYVPKSSLPEFKDFLKGKTEEFLAVRDELVDNYDLYVRQFKRRMEEDFLSATIHDSSERTDVLDAITSKIPTKEEVEESFKVEKSYMLFAMTGELMDDEDREAAVESANIRMNEINGNTASVIFDKLITNINALVKKKYTKTHDAIANEIVEELDKRNIFSHHALAELRDDFIKVKDNVDLDDYEIMIGKTYKFAKEIGTTDQLSLDESPLSLKQLDFLAKSL